MAERCGNCCFTSVPNFRKIHFSLDNAVRRITVSPGPVKLDSDLEDQRGSVNLRIQREFNGSQKVRKSRTERPIRNIDRIPKFLDSSAVPITGGVREKGSLALLSKTNLPLGRFPLYDYILYERAARVESFISAAWKDSIVAPGYVQYAERSPSYPVQCLAERDCLPRKSWSAPTMLSASHGILRVTARSLVPVDVIERVSRLWCRCSTRAMLNNGVLPCISVECFSRVMAV